MDANINTIAVESILFESNDTDVLLKGTARKGHMSYETDLIISHTQLNQLINTLQRQNNDLRISDLLESERMYDNEIMYSAKLPRELNREINTQELMLNQAIMQIRA